MSYNGIIYHNKGFVSEDGDGVDDSSGVHDACYIVSQFYDECMEYKRKTGLTDRLEWAYRYLNTDRPTHFNLESECEEDDCSSQESVTVSFDFLGMQHNIAMSIFEDALKFRGSDYVTVSPTPIADLPDDQKEGVRNKIFQNLSNELVRSVSASGSAPEDQNLLVLEAIHGLLGTDEGLLQIDSFISRFKRIEQARSNAEAGVKARNAKSMLDDIFAESNFDEIMQVLASQSFWYDYSLVRAPFKTDKKTTEITKSGALKETTKSVWCMENVHPLNHFFASDTTFYDMGAGEGDVTWLSRADLVQLKGIKNSVDEDIDHILDNFLSYTYSNEINEEEHTDEDDTEFYQYTDKIPVVRAVMRLEIDVLKKIFGKDYKGPEKGSTIVEFWCSNDKVLYQAVEPRYIDYNPYRKNGYKIKDFTEIHSSRGIYSILRSAQELIDNSARNLFHNLQNLPNYITEINKSKLSDPEDVEDELESAQPIIYTSSLGYRAEFGGNDRAVSIITRPDNIQTYLTAMREAVSLTQQLGFSAFALGQQNPANVRSAGQAAILNSNSNRDFSRMFQQQENLVETPIANYIWVSEAIDNKDPSIVVDSKIIVQTYTGFLQQQSESDDLSILAQSLAALFNQRVSLLELGQDVTWLDGLISKIAENSGLAESDLPFGQDEAGLLESVGINPQPQAQANPVPINLDQRNNIPESALTNTPV